MEHHEHQRPEKSIHKTKLILKRKICKHMQTKKKNKKKITDTEEEGNIERIWNYSLSTSFNRIEILNKKNVYQQNFKLFTNEWQQKKKKCEES